MTVSSDHKKFEFQPPFNADYLFELYQNDLIMVEEVFAVTTKNYDDDIHSIIAAYEANEVGLLLRNIHRFKPTLGFVGLPDLLKKCQQLEDSGKEENDMKKIDGLYHDLIAELKKHRHLIEKTYLQLKDFNARNL